MCDLTTSDILAKLVGTPDRISTKQLRTQEIKALTTRQQSLINLLNQNFELFTPD